VREVVIVGGGIVGLATAYSILRDRPGADVAVMEKETQVARHQSGHNSGVIHSGAYYRPGSQKAQFCLEGRRMLLDFCAAQGIPYRTCGKLIVATAEHELPRLRLLGDRARQNGVAGVAELDPAGLRTLEPDVAGIAALEVPTAGIVDYTEVARVLVERIGAMGGQVLTGCPVVSIRVEGEGLALASPGSEMRARRLVNCAGLQCDRVARMAGVEPGIQIVPFRGEYYWLRAGTASGLSHLIYPVPDPTLPFLGVHVTLTLHGRVEVGPNAVLAFAREGYRRETVEYRELLETLAFPGFWAMARRHWRTGIYENFRSLNRTQFADDVSRLVPSISSADLGEPGAGVRAQAVGRDGQLLDDFVIQSGPSSVHVLNAPSPAATSSLAIGKEIARRVPTAGG
jgi:(S)-2-hydroxyglutarate dehydrogenase